MKPCIPLKPINTAIGRQALYKNDIGLGYNVAIGYQSGMYYGSGSNYKPVLKNQHILDQKLDLKADQMTTPL